MESDSKESGVPQPPRIVTALDDTMLAKFYPKDAEPVVFRFAVKFAHKEGSAVNFSFQGYTDDRRAACYRLEEIAAEWNANSWRTACHRLYQPGAHGVLERGVGNGWWLRVR